MYEIFFALDEDLRCTYWSEASVKATGIPAAAALGKGPQELLPQCDAITLAEAVYREVLRSRRPRVFVNQYRLQGGDALLEISVYPSQTGLTALAKNITERGEAAGGSVIEADPRLASVIADHAATVIDNLRLFEQVLAGRERLQELVKQLIMSQEEERQRLARELHDDLGQSLTALKISLELLLADVPRGAAPLRQPLAQAIALTRETMQRLRALAHDLYPPDLRAVGLHLHMEQLCRDLAESARLEINYEGEELPELPDATALALYRCLQEALTNVVKHAGATQVRVALRAEDDAARLVVSDNGHGFDPEAALSSSQSRGLGLRALRERFNLLGGLLEIESAPGRGSRLVALAPLRQSHLERRKASAARSNS